MLLISSESFIIKILARDSRPHEILRGKNKKIKMLPFYSYPRPVFRNSNFTFHLHSRRDTNILTRKLQ